MQWGPNPECSSRFERFFSRLSAVLAERPRPVHNGGDALLADPRLVDLVGVDHGSSRSVAESARRIRHLRPLASTATALRVVANGGAPGSSPLPSVVVGPTSAAAQPRGGHRGDRDRRQRQGGAGCRLPVHGPERRRAHECRGPTPTNTGCEKDQAVRPPGPHRAGRRQKQRRSASTCALRSAAIADFDCSVDLNSAPFSPVIWPRLRNVSAVS